MTAATIRPKAADSMEWTRTGRGFVDAAGGAWRSRLPAGADGPDPVDHPSRAGRPALFLDRDGVVVEEVDYLGRPEDVRLTPGAGAALKAARDEGFAIVVVTNQSGIARGYYDWAAFEAVHDEIDRQLAADGALVDAVYACGYHASGRDGLARPDHPWRKPAPGMILAGLADLGIDAARSIIVGDRASDLGAGRAAGLAGGVLVATGYGAGEGEVAAATALGGQDFFVDRAANLADSWLKLRALAIRREG